MEKVKVGNFTIDRCTACRAIWFDVKELRMVAADPKIAKQVDGKGAAGRQRNVKASAGTLCPRDCGRLIDMVDPKQPHVSFLGCSTCGGILLDAGELTDLADFSLGERLKSFFRV